MSSPSVDLTLHWRSPMAALTKNSNDNIMNNDDSDSDGDDDDDDDDDENICLT